MTDSAPYLYPGTSILRNRLGILDAERLEIIERRFVTQRIRAGLPRGNFDLAHLQAIHLQMFQDVYYWAGELRTVEINKGGHQFQFVRFIPTGMADLHRRLEAADFLRGLDRYRFAAKAGEIIGDVNYVHPFREGNGRVQLQYLKQLGEQAGHPIMLVQLDPEGWIEASRRARRGDYDAMALEIGRAIAGA